MSSSAKTISDNNLVTTTPRHFAVITLFPEIFEPVFNSSMLWKAQDKNLACFHLVNLREFGIGPRRQVDDTPYGGGDGMLLKPEPIFAAVEHTKSLLDKHTSQPPKVILLTPKGKLWRQADAQALADDTSPLIFICSHYEGYDERILTLVDQQISLGHFILTGGELPTLAVIDSVVRLIPGVLGGATSAEIESFSNGDNLEYPQYTRPADFRGQKVPDVLLSGNHAAIAAWRDAHSSTVSSHQTDN
ncbi:tRNA (guanosine(37)-N1)-methyltransferase TrmD [Candidatus Saccharibacteria bacterium]|nr:tRNA (guanosine(37)-N1)-methyltransferase TrmD [Candidatus Saccharibacteria bacterium]